MLVIFLIAFILVWLHPVKRSIALDDVVSYENTDRVCIVCRHIYVTGYDWVVIDNLGNEEIINHTEFNIRGYHPYRVINKDIRSDFLFIGTFSNGVFIVDNWELVGDIVRGDEMIPYHQKYLNIFDIGLGSYPIYDYKLQTANSTRNS